MHKLQRFLIDYDMSMLRTLARNRGVALATNRQTEAADELAALLLDPLSVRTALAQLSTEGRDALQALQAAGGRMRALSFARRFGQVRPVGPGRLQRQAPWQEPASPAEELWYAALIFYAFDQDEGGPGEFVFIPDDLRPLLPQPRIEPATFAVEMVPPPPGLVSDEEALVRELFAYLVYLQNHDVRPYADGRLGQRDLAALRRRMGNGGQRRFAFLQHLARRLEFIERQGEFLRLDAAPVKQWLAAPAARQLATLQESWRDDPTWNDLCRVPSLTCDQETPWRNDPVATRQALLALLARCPLEGWWSVASFIAAVKETAPDFQRPDGDYASWYIRDAASGDYFSGFASWDQVEGALIADLLAGPLDWLGIVDTAAEGAVCRLTGAGARFLGLVQDEAAESPAPPIVVHADLRVEVPPPASLYTRFQLERFADAAEPEGIAPSSQASARPLHYRLGAGSLGRALSRGIQLEQVLAFLQQASEHPVPANVAGQLRLWAGRFGQVEVEEVALLRVKSERALKELSVLPETRHLIARILTPTSALIHKRDLGRLRRELQGLGYLLPEEPDSDPAGRG
jgi:hypothetical protein